ncbi:MAG: DUF3426 domain-containing protein [Alphaproteobacteria bacterium]
MIATCPNCTSRFHVEDKALGTDGRKVRCGSCSHAWLLKPVAEDAPADAEVAFEDPPAETGAGDAKAAEAASTPKESAAEPAKPEASRPATPRPAPQVGQRSRARMVLWLIFIVLIAGIVGGGYRYRQLVVNRWPSATGIYEAVGISVIPPPSYSFTFVKEKVETKFETIDGKSVLSVSGVITNKSSRARPVPHIRIYVRDKAKNLVQTWSFSIKKKTLKAGESAEFKTRIKNLAPGADKIEFQFRYPGPVSDAS